MTVHWLRNAPSPELSLALERFEAPFRYPLGPGRFFRISHGDDYPRFFCAMGDGVCFVAERDGNVLGVLGAAVRRLALPDGGECAALYLGDLKITHDARGGMALLRLADATRQWLRARADAAFSVVMDGTPVAPDRYTGRLGIPRFDKLGKIMVLRLSTSRRESGTDDCWVTTAERGMTCYSCQSAGRYAALGGEPAERSETSPLWLLEPGGRACGRLEDTRRAKRLISDDGVEMRSAHLSCFAYQNPCVGAALVRRALGYAAARDFPALFVAVAAAEAEDICRHLGETDAVLAPATIYGVGLEPGPLWNINTAEI